MLNRLSYCAVNCKCLLGFLKVTAIGFGDSKEQQDKVQVELYFPTDPGYRDTVTMVLCACVL